MLPTLWAERVLKSLIMERRVLVEEISKEHIRKDFQNYRNYVCKIRRKKEQLTVIKSKLTGLHSAKITDMPKVATPKNDKNLYLLQEKIEIEDALKKLVKKKESERKRLNKILKELESDDTANLLTRKPEVLTAEASVLKLRYMCGFSWEDINKAFYEEDSDFYENIENYLRNIYRYHGQAFVDLQKMIKGK